MPTGLNTTLEWAMPLKYGKTTTTKNNFKNLKKRNEQKKHADINVLKTYNWYLKGMLINTKILNLQYNCRICYLVKLNIKNDFS